MDNTRHQYWFSLDDQNGNLKRQAVRGTLATASGKLATQFIRLAGVFVLARLILPEHFGLIAMIMAVLGIAGVFKDMGLAAATFRAQNLTHQQTSNLFWLNLLTASSCALLAAACVPLLASFYNEPKVLLPGLALAVGFLISGAATQHLALLRRKMHFRQLAYISIGNMLVSTLASIVWALYSPSFWALVGGSLIGQIWTLVTAWFHCSWRPSPPRRKAGTKHMVTFGMNMLVFNTLGYMSKNIHGLIIGKTSGAVGAGLMSRANLLNQLILSNLMEPPNLVAPSGMTRLMHTPERFSKFYYKVCRLTLILILPASYMGWMHAEGVILFVLGDNWVDAIPLFQILALGLVPQAICYTSGWVYLSAGNVKAMMKWGLLGWSVIIMALIIGASISLKATAAAAAISYWLLLVPCMKLAFTDTNLSLKDLFHELYPVLLIASASYGAASIIHYALNIQNPILDMLTALLYLGGCYGGLLLISTKQRQLIFELLQQLKTPSQTLD